MELFFEKFDNILYSLKNILDSSGYSLATAESCTGGLLGAVFTSIPGSSSFFETAIVTYSNKQKVELLNIDKNILFQYGAVSEECAEAMAKGIQKIASVNIAISVTGIAGPDGGTPKKPVGTVFSTTIIDNNVTTYKFSFTGTRNEIRVKTVEKILKNLLEKLNKPQMHEFV